MTFGTCWELEAEELDIEIACVVDVDRVSSSLFFVATACLVEATRLGCCLQPLPDRIRAAALGSTLAIDVAAAGAEVGLGRAAAASRAIGAADGATCASQPSG
jgi:hypothetical protein